MIDIILNLNAENNIDSYSLDNLNVDDKLDLLCALIDIPTNVDYKMQKYYNIFNFIVDNLNKIYDENITYEIDKIILEKCLLKKLTNLNKGQHILKKLDHRIKNFLFIDEDFIPYLIEASKLGTFCTFNFWLDKIKCLDDTTYETIFINSIVNSDDRIYKHFLNKDMIENNIPLVKSMISTLALSYIPTKYILKRLKLLSEYVDLKLFFKHLIENFKNKQIILKIFKYYYSEPINYYIINYTMNLLLDDTQSSITQIYDFVKTEKEKVIIDIILSIKYYPIIEYVRETNYDTQMLKEIINENISLLLYDINWYYFYENELNIKILKIITEDNLITKNLTYWNIEFIDLHLLFFTRFLSIKTSELVTNNKIIKINYFLHKLRIAAKKIIKKNIIIRKTKMIDLLIEIKTFLPNEKKPVLKNGSLSYQYEKQKFNNLLLKDKINGILVNNVPINSYPNIDIINKYQIKAEYIEEQELYLVIDIDIPNTTFTERYNILRSIHPATKNVISDENKNINTFLLSNNEKIKWYPKLIHFVS